MVCGICNGSMDFDDEIWAWVCNDCGNEFELEPGEVPEEFDLSDDEDEDNEQP